MITTSLCAARPAKRRNPENPDSRFLLPDLAQLLGEQHFFSANQFLTALSSSPGHSARTD
jgi:hypothetical protein